MQKLNQYIVPAFLSLILFIASFSLNQICAQGQRIAALEQRVVELNTLIQERTNKAVCGDFRPP